VQQECTLLAGSFSGSMTGISPFKDATMAAFAAAFFSLAGWLLGPAAPCVASSASPAACCACTAPDFNIQASVVS
jgi:hypothetical protein